MQQQSPSTTSSEVFTSTTIQVVYAPLPDDDDDNNNSEDSAALEFSNRTVAYLLRDNKNYSQEAQGRGGVDVLPPLHMKDYTVTLQETEIPNSVATDGGVGGRAGVDSSTNYSTLMITVFIVSCGLDGSVHRSVRKVSKSFRTNNPNINTTSTNTNSNKDLVAAVALLGHAVCKTSSEQAADEIFMAGRRFVKSIILQQQQQQQQQRQQQPGKKKNTIPTLETQVELVDPETEFDPWLETLRKQFFVV